MLNTTNVGNATQGQGVQTTKCDPAVVRISIFRHFATGFMSLYFLDCVVCQQQRHVDEVTAP